MLPVEEPVRAHGPLGAQALWKGQLQPVNFLTKAEMRMLTIYCMREAVFCVACISFEAGECSRRPRGELGFVPLTMGQAPSFLMWDRSTRSTGSPWALPPPAFWVSSNLGSKGPAVLAPHLRKAAWVHSRSVFGKGQSPAFVLPSYYTWGSSPASGWRLLLPHPALTLRVCITAVVYIKGAPDLWSRPPN